MQITVEIPDPIAEQIAQAGGDARKKLLEAFAAEEYRHERLSRGQVSELLSLNFWETEQFLKDHQGYLSYDADSMDIDNQNLAKLLER